MRRLHAQRTLDPEVLFRVPSMYNYDVSPKSDKAAFSWDRSGQFEIYSLKLSTGKTDLLTKGPESKVSPRFAPSGNRLAYAQDYQGDEKYDIFILSMAGGETWNLTPATDETIYPRVRWSPDEKQLAFASNRGGRFSIYTIPSQGGEPDRVSDHEFSDSSPEWSPDGKLLAFEALVSAQDDGVFVAPAKGGETIRLAESGVPVESSSPKWSPDGRAIAFTSSERGSSDIGIWNLEHGSVEWLTDSRCECYSPEWFPDGRGLSYVVNREGNQSIAIHNLETHGTGILEVEAGVHSQLRFGGDRWTLFFTFSSSRHPSDLWMVDLKNRTFRQLTNSLPVSIDQSLLVSGSSISFQSRDQLGIQAWLFLPRDFDKKNPGSALVYVHGGPTAQFTNDWRPVIQHLVDLGHAVIAPNYRGSSGFGRKFRDANRFVLGEKDLEDVVAAADYLAKERLADPKRIGVLGGSYGGYLTMCALTKFPKYWAVGSAMMPFLNWFTEIENEREDLRYWDLQNMGDPKKDSERLREASPIFLIDRIEAPVQIIAGEHDPRCPVLETKQAEKELRKSGKVFDLVIYEDEGHGFRKIENRVDADKRRARFLTEHLKAK